MVWNAKTRTWKVVPSDFIADLPVDLAERRYPRYRTQRSQ
jgi:hypothetical protein